MGWGVVDMRGRGWSAASAAAMMLGCVGAAGAADLDTIATKAPLTKAPPGPTTCTDIPTFLLTDCQLAWYGVRFYGTIDVGYGYQTNGAPWDRNFPAGNAYFISKNGRKALWELSPNGLSQSNVGIQIKEPLGPGWSFIGQLETAFDPYSLDLGDGPRSLANNRGVPLNQQTANGDSSQAGQFYNSQGYVGLSSDTYGTLTVFRQRSLMAEAVGVYDPMAGSYAFSPLGFSGLTSGGGDTENVRYSTAVKYRLNYGNYRLAALAQFGGYDLNNGSKGAFQGQLGGDVHIGPGVLSLDAIGGYVKDAVSLSLAGAADIQSPLTATLSDNTNVMALARYTFDKLKLYAGYEWIQFAPPSDPITVGGFNDLAGDFICAGCQIVNGTNINNLAFSASNGFKDRIMQVVWAGARYSVTDSLDVAVAYYHYDQNSFAASSANISSCAKSATSLSSCAGTMDTVSALIDWKFAPKWDTYVGTMFSQMNGGLDSGFLSRSNLATTAGVRFRW